MSATVLIADGHGERGRRIAAACRALSLRVQRVANGAKALEVALAEPPTAMVAALDLPLIGGAQLADILQANPQTRSIGVLFVGGETPTRAEQNMGRVLPGLADPETISRFVQALLARREALGQVAAADAPGSAGELAQIALAELLDLFHVNRKTGVLELDPGEHGGESAQIFLLEGEVIQARCGPLEGEKALYRLLGWRQGRFAFRNEAVEEAVAIRRPVRSLLREAERQAEEWQRLRTELPDPQARVALVVARSSLPSVLHPLTQEVLLVLELSERVQDVLDRSSYPDYQVMRTLQTLAHRGIVELRSEAGSGGDALVESAPAARLRDWLERGLPRGDAPRDAKVVVLGASPELLRAFQRLAEKLPGAEPAAEASAPGVWPLLRLPIEGEIGLEWVGVPASRRYQAIWPLAAHGALAVVFVHGGEITDSVDALRDACEALERTPRTRSFHLILEPKDADADAVETLCERLALFDDRAVLTLHPEHSETAGAALRDFLARLLP